MKYPQLCRIVLLSLSATMAEEINRRRTTGREIAERALSGKWPTGAQAHIGPKVTEGELVPAIIVKVRSESVVNVKAFLDGSDEYWATNVPHYVQGEEPAGTWEWPDQIHETSFGAGRLRAEAEALPVPSAQPSLAGIEVRGDAPRVTKHDIEDWIVAEYVGTADSMFPGSLVIPTLGLLTICVLVLRTGFKVVGKSACVSPENFDADIGIAEAKKNAREQLWELLGFALSIELHNAELSVPQPVPVGSEPISDRPPYRPAPPPPG